MPMGRSWACRDGGIRGARHTLGRMPWAGCPAAVTSARRAARVCEHGTVSASSSARAAVAELELVGAASDHLTETVAVHLPFEGVVAFKTALKRYFSHAPWTAEDDRRLSDIVAPHLESGWWALDLGHGLTLEHGVDGGRYVIRVGGEATRGPSVFDRVFSGPVRPEQTPHPRKVKFHIGGTPSPGVWHRRGEDVDDERVARLMADGDITDVMVAGDFVTVGLRSAGAWEDRLDAVLDAVTALFWSGEQGSPPGLTREEMLEEAGRRHTIPRRPEDLHLMDPDDEAHRAVLVDALGADDPRRRRAAVVTLALSGEGEVARAAVVTGYRDDSRMVRRAAVDAAADLEDDEYRPLFEEALIDADAWIRWRGLRAIAALGVGPSEEAVILAAADEDFRVRFEAASILQAGR
jgi:hypothetical protein